MPKQPSFCCPPMTLCYYSPGPHIHVSAFSRGALDRAVRETQATQERFHPSERMCGQNLSYNLYACVQSITGLRNLDTTGRKLFIHFRMAKIVRVSDQYECTTMHAWLELLAVASHEYFYLRATLLGGSIRQVDQARWRRFACRADKRYSLRVSRNCEGFSRFQLSMQRERKMTSNSTYSTRGFLTLNKRLYKNQYASPEQYYDENSQVRILCVFVDVPNTSF